MARTHGRGILKFDPSSAPLSSKKTRSNKKGTAARSAAAPLALKKVEPPPLRTISATIAQTKSEGRQRNQDSKGMPWES